MTARADREDHREDLRINTPQPDDGGVVDVACLKR